ncbi:MAG: stage II sporulation protein R [Clostridia bacterium]|nr:stage II sporulation protein R [Clostridia bacterium]
MKTFCITFLTFLIIILAIIGIGVETPLKSSEYLRIHVRANSNEKIDQAVKLKVKDNLVNYLTPILTECKTKEKAKLELEKRLEELDEIINSTLEREGFAYKGKAKLREEEFPTRKYEGIILESGFYDALIVELGEGKGDNWWCVVYPPLCFVRSENVEYRSKIKEIIEKFYKA